MYICSHKRGIRYSAREFGTHSFTLGIAHDVVVFKPFGLASSILGTSQIASAPKKEKKLSSLREITHFNGRNHDLVKCFSIDCPLVHTRVWQLKISKTRLECELRAYCRNSFKEI